MPVLFCPPVIQVRIVTLTGVWTRRRCGSATELDMQTGRDEVDSVCDSGVADVLPTHSALSESGYAVAHLPSPLTFTDDDQAPGDGDAVTTTAEPSPHSQLLQLFETDKDGDT